MANVQFALNHMTAPSLSLDEFFALAKSLGVDQVEIRNDLQGNAIQDGTSAEIVKTKARDYGLSILSINALYPFNRWDDALAAKAQALIDFAAACGSKGLVLVPLNDGTGKEDGLRQENLRKSLAALKPMLEKAGVTGLVEPLGFEFCSLRSKTEALEAIKAVDGLGTFKLVHDTFHHHLADEPEIYPEQTGLVHISGVTDKGVTVADMRDPHRVLVDSADRLDNVGQIRALRTAGCDAPCSFEPFAPQLHDLADPKAAVAASMAYINANI
jgi:2-keto-myo-inositol isomerase